MAEYPKRFYKAGKGRRVLKFPKEMIKPCKWCGRFYVRYPHSYKRSCSKRCMKFAIAMGWDFDERKVIK